MRPETTNADRAWWALHALGDFVNRTGVHDREEAISDLITNLLHLARAANLDPSMISGRALAAMEGEVAEDDEGDMTDVVRSLDVTIDQAAALAMPWRAQR